RPGPSLTSGAPAPPEQRALERRLGREAVVSPAEPGSAGGVPSPLPPQLADVRSIGVFHSRPGTELEPPSRLLKTPAEIGVLGGAYALEETAELLERGPPDHQVRSDCARHVGVRQVGLLAEEAASGS